MLDACPWEYGTIYHLQDRPNKRILRVQVNKNERIG
uniref:Uncharacterized protein n=1 Tax=Arundo donax TaxID=35708 RepID=A0A0A8ZBR7_ARUDO